ncbi:phosphofructokinase [Mycobacterium phage SWU2]|uniref:DUF6378 domain-containing protein n=1 Tax=Mycobacterium phage SWU2 TaxID=2077150 RepID=A0A2K9VI50_9CAUD|nr:phosphofructokinase [Mycobacterium phage SWU2]AUV62010.1 hypothetical protein JX_gp51 [Mycobacterium phage SWU2]
MTQSILEEAQTLIHGQRNKDYGHPRENFGYTAELFSAYLGIKVTMLDVAQLMMLLKMARQKGTGYHRDSTTDIAGYAGCIERCYDEDPEVIDGEVVDLDAPRVWNRLADIPEDVLFEDKDGDRRYSFLNGWRWDGTKLSEAEVNGDWDYAPYTEIV